MLPKLVLLTILALVIYRDVVIFKYTNLKKPILDAD